MLRTDSKALEPLWVECDVNKTATFFGVDQLIQFPYNMGIVTNKESAMSKLFAYAGTCVVDGATVYKFANDANRAAVLTKLGATDVNIIALPNPMDKAAAVAYLAQVGITAGKAPRVAKTAKVAKTKTVAKVATPVAKTRRVGDKPRRGQDPEEFVAQWFADKAARVGDRFYPKAA